MRRHMAIALAAGLIMSLGALAPVSAKTPLTGTMTLQFNLGWSEPSNDVPIWVGNIVIDGAEYGMAFFNLGTGKPFEEDRPGLASFFGERWAIYHGLDFTFDENGFLTEFVPGPTALWGYDAGVVSFANVTYRMNGSVEDASAEFAEWIGRNVHMSGTIEFSDAGAPLYAPGMFRVN